MPRPRQWRRVWILGMHVMLIGYNSTTIGIYVQPPPEFLEYPPCQSCISAHSSRPLPRFHPRLPFHLGPSLFLFFFSSLSSQTGECYLLILGRLLLRKRPARGQLGELISSVCTLWETITGYVWVSRISNRGGKRGACGAWMRAYRCQCIQERSRRKGVLFLQGSRQTNSSLLSINIISLAPSSSRPALPLLSPSHSIPEMADMVIIAECQAPQACGNT